MSCPSPHVPAPDIGPSVEAALRSAGATETTLVVGVSGGADSLALLRVVLDLQEGLRLKVVAAHLDHGFRAESKDDADWIAAVCREWQVPLFTERLELAQTATVWSEEFARDARRGFYRRACRTAGAPWLALGHNANDQVETILHRLLRGTGPRGLAGMSVVAHLDDGVRIVRPLLALPREDLVALLVSRGQAWRTDATNADPRFTRNRIRHELLPLLRQQFNPQVDAALLRLARQCSEMSAWLSDCARVALRDALLEQQPESVRLSIASLQPLPRPVLLELLATLWRAQHWSERRMTCEHWEDLADLARDSSAKTRQQFPGGLDVSRDGLVLRIERRGGRADAHSSHHA